MSYSSLRAAANDLEKHGKLIRIKSEVDPNLEMAEIHRRIFEKQGPAILFEMVKGSPFQALSNLYGTYEQTDFLFRHTIERVKKLIEVKADPTRLLQNPMRYAGVPFTALSALPRRVARLPAPISYGRTTISMLPQIKSWPMDGGAFVTTPQVMTLPPGSKKAMESNIGMYRIQLSGNEYVMDQEIGLHYQLHRGIGVHHTMYQQSDEDFRCAIFVGGPPSHAFAAIMPLPEGLSELTFAGLLAGRRFRYVRHQGHILSADADFVITGIIRKGEKKPEGPFGDHLGYYSLTHDFPVMEVEEVYHRKDPLWHFTVVGRPPMEDSSFGYLIHQLVKELTTQEFPGVRQIHAVDAAGVHPLLLAIGSERYMPFRERRPEEILTQANRIIGSGQTSLAKYLWIAAGDDQPTLNAKDIPAFFQHMLERIQPERDLHFHTKTTIDTLDYSGDGWNAGSKVVIAAAGKKIRELGTHIPDQLSLSTDFSNVHVAMPGVLAIQGPLFKDKAAYQDPSRLITQLESFDLQAFPLIVLCDDSAFVAANTNNFVWVTFTRSNPSHDLHGVGATIVNKHWGCTGPIIIDARMKPHHAPELIPDAKVSAKVDKLFSKGGELYGVI